MSDFSRQIWDMKYRLKAADGTPVDHDVADSWARVAIAAAEAEKPAAASPAGVEADVRSALINLGYDERTAETAVKEAKGQVGVASFEKLLRASLNSVSTPQKR